MRPWQMNAQQGEHIKIERTFVLRFSRTASAIFLFLFLSHDQFLNLARR